MLTPTPTVWLAFQLQHLLCAAMFWFKHVGWLNITATHFIVWARWSQKHSIRGWAQLLPHLIHTVPEYTETVAEQSMQACVHSHQMDFEVSCVWIWARAPSVKTS